MHLPISRPSATSKAANNVVVPYVSAFAAAGYDDWRDLTRGAITGVVDLTGCLRIGGEFQPPPSPEFDFGDYRTGRLVWMLANPHELTKPIPARGALRIFNWVPVARDITGELLDIIVKRKCDPPLVGA